MLSTDENDNDTRFAFNGSLPGALIKGGSNDPLECRPVNLSASGLGLIGMQELFVGDKLTIVSPELNIPFEVVWCDQVEDRPGFFKIGLKSNDSEIDLVRLFSDEGCFEDCA